MARSEADIFPLDKAVMGGSYDPVHRGHISSGIYLLKNSFARDVYFMPAGVSPFKTASPPIRADDRIAMIKLALDAVEPAVIREHLFILDIETNRPGPSFTCDSLRELRERYPGERIGFVMGQDSLSSFEKWKNPPEILRYHPVLVLKRRPEDDSVMNTALKRLREIYSDENPEIAVMENPVIECSSTYLREKLSMRTGRNRKELEECLPAPVLDFIIRRNLYKK